jgi:hypothetical protein
VPEQLEHSVLVILLPPGVDVQRRSWTQGTSANAGH